MNYSLKIHEELAQLRILEKQ